MCNFRNKDVNDSTDSQMIIYHNGYAVAVCKPDYYGFMGIYSEELLLSYPIGTRLDIGLIGNLNNYEGEVRVSMIVNRSSLNGTALRLNDFDKDNANNWKELLQSIGKISKNNKLQQTESR